MSIIHEALKKTGQTVINEPPQAKKPAEKSPVRITPVSHKKAAVNWKPLLVLAILVIAAAPFFAGRILRPGSADPGASTALGQFRVEEIPVAPSPASMRAPQSRASGPFRLTGLVYEGADSFCLINGLVLRAGDTVGGATVEKITPEAVTLDKNGQKITLSVSN